MPMRKKIEDEREASRGCVEAYLLYVMQDTSEMVDALMVSKTSTCRASSSSVAGEKE